VYAWGVCDRAADTIYLASKVSLARPPVRAATVRPASPDGPGVSFTVVERDLEKRRAVGMSPRPVHLGTAASSCGLMLRHLRPLIGTSDRLVAGLGLSRSYLSRVVVGERPGRAVKQ